MQIRREEPSDHDAVLEVDRRAFGDQGAVVAALVDGLRRDDPDALSLVAVEADRVTGHVMCTRSLLDAPPRLVDVQVLSPLAVLPGHQRQGLGSALVAAAAETVAARGVPLLFLEGDPAYYSRLGFTPGGERGFRKPSLRIPDAAFQVMLLPAYEPWMTGTLVYSATFWEYDCVGLR
ncbi:N-acetyltransferase [Actinoplanes sp. NPDC049316]|uniref:GNAT family N-acetyltransferase n=1 Tax=Actinoplanes sp. NPDC049316 TaxID=3154727 RepID=UPI0034485605